MTKKKTKTIPLDEVIDSRIGEIGSPKRDQFEAKLKETKGNPNTFSINLTTSKDLDEEIQEWMNAPMGKAPSIFPVEEMQERPGTEGTPFQIELKEEYFELPRKIILDSSVTATSEVSLAEVIEEEFIRFKKTNGRLPMNPQDFKDIAENVIKRLEV